MRLSFIKCHGSGNDFPLIDARAVEADWPLVARLLADRSGPVGGDGLLLLVPGAGGAAFGMRMFNPDGSEAETCLNGLRCTARLGFEATGLVAAEVSLRASRAAARREADIAPGVVTIGTAAAASTDTALVGLNIADPMLVEARVPGLPSERQFTAVAMPNPHLVSFVEAVDEDELVALGDWVEAGPALMPGRGNVSFVEDRRGGRLFVRTYERGVGLTNACGSAMAASTFAAGLTGRIGWGAAVTVFNAGGLVRTEAGAPADGAVVRVSGNATFEWDGVIEVEGGRLGPLEVTNRREGEVRAWDAAVAALT